MYICMCVRIYRYIYEHAHVYMGIYVDAYTYFFWGGNVIM